MRSTRYGMSLFASALMISAMAASAAQASCPANNIIGTWDDQFGSVATITSKTKGTATASSAVCNKTGTIYKLAITLVGGPPPTTAKVVGTAPKASGCPVVHATLKYQKGSCTVASGPVKFNGITLQDTWTKQAKSTETRRQSQSSSVSDGLK
jgi:hypothetical protein